MSSSSSFEVRVHGILTNSLTSGKKSYVVRWLVAGERFRRTFVTKALAEGFRSRLTVAQRAGTPFDIATGLPEPEARKLRSRTWLELAIEFTDAKWAGASPKHRKNIAEALATVTPALLTTTRGAPSETRMRAALYGWAFNKAKRDSDDTPPPQMAQDLAWLSAHSIEVSALDDAALMRRALDKLSIRLDGTPAAGPTVTRKRTAFSSALKYAVELRQLDTHPLTRVTWTAPKQDDVIDRRTVVNPTQARALLAAVRDIAPDLEAFFGCLYFAALRPEEALHLTTDEVLWPTGDDGWGWLNLTGATVTIGRGWTNDDKPTEDRSLKHRGRNATRRVPASPELLGLLRRHLDAYGTSAEGRLFVTRRGPGGRYRPTAGRPLSGNAYTRVWHKARAAALSEAQAASPLARVPYQLRHAAVSLWLNSGVPPTQVADWAGHSVNVLLRVYAHCLDGGDDAARRRIADALGGGGLTT